MSHLIAVLDSCVLFPFYLRDLLLRVAEAELYRPRWSRQIWDDAMRNLIDQGHLTKAQASWLEQNVNAAFTNAMVQVPAGLDDMMQNHPGDRHVLAAAVVAKADVIITANTKHFPAQALAPWRVEAQTPDEFLMSLYNSYAEEVFEAVLKQASDLKKPPKTVLELLELLSRQVPTFSAEMNRLYDQALKEVQHQQLKEPATPQIERVLAQAADRVEMPYYGEIGSGTALNIGEQYTETRLVPRHLARKGDSIVRALGDSMDQAGIASGSLLVIKHQRHAQHRQVVVANVQHLDTTCKRYIVRDGTAWLVPESSVTDFYDIPVNDEVEIVGVVKACWYDREFI